VLAGERPTDEVLDLVCREVGEAKPRHWRGLLRQSKATLAAMEDQLIRAGVFNLEGRGMVAIDRQAIAGLQTRARQILSGEAGDGGTGILDAALVAVASVIPLRTLFDRRRKRQDRQRVDALTRLVSISAPGFERLPGQIRPPGAAPTRPGTSSLTRRARGTPR
jgi:hypothetical protein